MYKINFVTPSKKYANLIVNPSNGYTLADAISGLENAGNRITSVKAIRA